jgi:hypothetical protein
MAKKGKNGALKSLKLLDYSDRELLLIVMEQSAAMEDGYATTGEVADTLGIEGDHRRNCVGVRLGYMRRIGAVDKAPDSPTRWTVTPIGKMMATGQIKSNVQKQLDNLGPETMLLLTRFVGQRQKQSPTVAGQLIHREWKHTIGKM